jgi:SpoVK/Ycf46/Vps4 family AAA+-type ATPase
LKWDTITDWLSHLFEKFGKRTEPPAEPQAPPLGTTPKSERPEVPPKKLSGSYTSPQAHLLDELCWINRLVAAHVLRLRQVHFYESVKDLHGFFISEKEIDALVDAGVFERNGTTEDCKHRNNTDELMSQAMALRASIGRCVKESVDKGMHLPLEQLQKLFRLSDLEINTLLICMAPLLDARYERLFAYLQNDFTKKTVSLDLIAGLLDLSYEERLDFLASFRPGAPLRDYHLLEKPEEGNESSLAQTVLRADPRIVHYILGQETTDRRLMSIMRMSEQRDREDVAIEPHMRDRLRTLFESTLSKEGKATFYFHGRPGVGRKTLARALCAEVGLPLALVDLRAILRNQESFREKTRLILREGLLQPCGVCFDRFEKLESADDELLLTEVMEEIKNLGWVVFLCSENPPPPHLLDLPSMYSLEVAYPDAMLQSTLWHSHLQGLLAGDESVALIRLTARFDLTGEQIARACRQAKQTALLRSHEDADSRLSDMYESCRSVSQPRLGTFARKIRPMHTWDDLVLPPDHLSHLRELASQVEKRQIVMREWGFETKLTLGKGISALFTGPSGTGKTMSAEVISNALGLDLFKIDLSAVVSKYIGETEKNLCRVFDEAEHSNAILFFDEADALLGKRSEVKDAHDRYANIEIAYLLQKMEEYEGVTILATNLRQNIDEAFTRRIRFIIDFPFPDENYRLRIWQGIWPRSAPLAVDVDLDFMARQFEFTGGNIRNAALAAAFFAANDGGVVSMRHLLLATKREFQKMGKLSVREDFGTYKELL